jgi:hypothetical protein
VLLSLHVNKCQLNSITTTTTTTIFSHIIHLILCNVTCLCNLCGIYASFVIGHGAVQRVDKGTEHSITERNDDDDDHHHHHHYHYRVGLMASILCEHLKYECPSGAVSLDRLCQIFPSSNSQVVHQYFIVSVGLRLMLMG